MDTDNYVEALRGRGAMVRFDEDALRKLVASCDVHTLQPSGSLWVSDEVRSHAYILVSGSIERTTRTHTGRVIQQYNAPGTLLSLSALVKPWAYHSTAHALEHTVVLALSRAKFLELFEAREPVAYDLVDAIGEYLVDDMRKANGRLQDVFGRPAETLMMLRRRIREDSKA